MKWGSLVRISLSPLPRGQNLLKKSFRLNYPTSLCAILFFLLRLNCHFWGAVGEGMELESWRPGVWFLLFDRNVYILFGFSLCFQGYGS
jgi:hypothetical protein